MIPAQQRSTSYDWYELAALLANGKMVRGHYVRVNNPNAVAAWAERFDYTDVLASVGFFIVPNNNSACILHWYFDIDCPDDLSAARESALTLCLMLMDRAYVPQESLDTFFSGAKGFHIVVAPEVFRAFSSPYTLGLYKKMAQKTREAGVRFLDESVYSRKRPFRLSNTRHRRSGLFKIPLCYEELRDLSMEGILQLAAGPRPDDTLARHEVRQETAEWYRRAIAAVAGLKGHSGPTPASAKFK
jgi:hypothetical protein